LLDPDQPTGIDVIRVAVERWLPSARVERGASSQVRAFFLLSGSGSLECGERELALNTGDGAVVSSDGHTLIAGESGLTLVILAAIGPAAVSLVGERAQANSLADADRWAEELAALAEAGPDDPEHPDLRKALRSRCDGAFAALVSAISSPPKVVSNRSRQDFDRAREILDRDYRTIGSVADLAKATGIDRSQLSRLFRRHADSTPLIALQRRKLAAAADLLERSSLSVAMVGQRCGFPDPSVFSRTFKRLMGISPGEWRRKN
jgi:AraC-like DNA-binding protein